MTGYAKLPHRLKESPVSRDKDALMLYINLLLEASIIDRTVDYNGTMIDLKKGQCVFSRPKWSDKLGMSERTVRTKLEMLEKLELVQVKSYGKKYSVITMCEARQRTANEPPTNRQEKPANDKGLQDILANEPPTERQRTANKEKIEYIDINNNIYTAFEKFWSEYPNQFNRDQTLKNFIKTAKAYGTKTVLRALDNYNAEIKRNGTEKKYITRSTNFVGQKAVFKGYLNGETGVVSNEPAIQPVEDVLARLKREGGFSD